MNAALPLPWPLLTWKSIVADVVTPGAVVLTCPVGPFASLGGALPRFGTFTVNGFIELVLPVSVYTVAVPDPWLETQSGLPVENANPQGLIKFRSVCCALTTFWSLVTRFVWT